MCAANKESLEVSFKVTMPQVTWVSWKVSFMELSQKVPTLAVFVADAPAEMLAIFGIPHSIQHFDQC